MRSRLPLLVTALVALPALTGCIATDDTPPPVTITTNDAEGNKSTFVNPTGTKSAAANETNKTVVGKGGIEHLHDYWEGATEKVIVDRGVTLGDPYFCDNGNTGKIGCAVIRPPVTDPATLVFEGTGKVEVTVSAILPTITQLEMSYKNGANPEWTSPVPVTADTPIVIEPTPFETDMPHAYSSQWAWRFVAIQSVPGAHPTDPDFHVTVKVVKAGKIVDWPGHPDFYADKPYRVVMDVDGTTTNAGQHDQTLYGDEASIVRPDLLISSGTGNLTLYLNITSAKTPAGDLNPDLYYIDYTNATGYWNGDYTEWNPAVNRLLGEKIDATHYVMTMPVRHTGWDSPYAPSSGWQFLVRPGYEASAEGRGARLSPQFLPYEVKFHLTIIATPDPQYLGTDALE